MHMKGEPIVGKEKWAKEKELRLSDAYIVKDNEPSLELKVKVINIRPEEHHEILEKCQVLKEYSQFMEIVQNYQISGVEEPYKKAIKECIEKGKTISEIADELEDTEENIARLIEEFHLRIHDSEKRRNHKQRADNQDQHPMLCNPLACFDH